MSLLANVNQPNTNGYYFALDTTPDTQIVTAGAFYATGGAGVGPNGQFTAKGDSAPAGSDVFNMVNNNGSSQWSMGLAVVPGGANSGNNLAFYSYDDSGAFIGAPLQIVRSTGGVVMPNGLTASQVVASGAMACESLTVGDASDVGGGVANIAGTLGVSRVYDNKYNPPFGAEVVLGQFSRTGVSVLSLPYMATNTGLYSLTMSVNIDANGLVWTPGTTGCIGYATLGGGGGTLSDSYLACDGIMLPSGTVPPIGAANVYIKDLVAIVTLNAGETVTASLYTQGAMDLGVQGAVTVYIQPLVA